MTEQIPIGIVGLGRVGGGAARALQRHGYAVCGYDVRAEAVAGIGVEMTAATSPAEVAGLCDIVLVSVMDDVQLRSVIVALAEAVSAARAVIVLSTVSLDSLRWARERLRACGAALLDCGITGGSAALDGPGMVGMIGGPAPLIAEARPVLETFLSPLIDVGESGNGMRAKLACNLVTYAGWLVAWEGARLALAAGVPLDRFVEVVREGDRLNPGHLTHISRGVGLPWGEPSAVPVDPAAVGATAGYVRKDLAAALALADELGVEVPAARLTVELEPAMLATRDPHAG